MAWSWLLTVNRVGLLLFVAVGVEYVILVSAMDIKKKRKIEGCPILEPANCSTSLKIGGKVIIIEHSVPIKAKRYRCSF